jgi:YjbE family integral membrane protein
MNNLEGTAIGILQIALINLVMSVDNIGIIALATKSLPKECAKKASAVGVLVVMLLYVFFALTITLIMRLDWLPLRLVGGIILLKITWDFIKPQVKGQVFLKKSSGAFWSAVLSIVVADMTISMDNVLAIGIAAKGNVWLLVFGLLINVPIILFAARFVIELINKYAIVNFICGAILACTAFNLILGDSLLSSYIPPAFELIVPFFIAVLVIAYGLFVVRSKKTFTKKIVDSNLTAKESRE